MRDRAADTMSTSSRAWRTMERTCGSVASLPARSAAAWTSLAAPMTSATWCRTTSARSVPRGSRRSSRSRPSSSPATERSERHTDGNSATGASLDSAWATATSASSTATHIRRRTRAAVPRLSCAGVARAA